jgi:hypothetical protein
VGVAFQARAIGLRLLISNRRAPAPPSIPHPRWDFPYTIRAPSIRRSAQSSSGASRDRTGDLLLAKQALSQLSYGPSNSALIDGGPATLHADVAPSPWAPVIGGKDNPSSCREPRTAGDPPFMVPAARCGSPECVVRLTARRTSTPRCMASNTLPPYLAGFPSKLERARCNRSCAPV